MSPHLLERMMRIELTPSAWKAEVLPLNYIRVYQARGNPRSCLCQLERKTRFELATLALARRCSTPEPLPHIELVEGDGFEPSKAQLTDLQSAPFGHSGIPRRCSRTEYYSTYHANVQCIFWSWRRESNPQPADYKSAALPLSHASKTLTSGFCS